MLEILAGIAAVVFVIFIWFCINYIIEMIKGD